MTSSPEGPRSKGRYSREDGSDVDSRGKYSRRSQRSISRSSEADDGGRRRGGKERRGVYGDEDDHRSDHKRRNHRRDRSTSDRDDERKHSRRDRDRSYRERSRSRDRSHRHRRSRSPPKKTRKPRSASSSPVRRSKAPLPSQDESYQAELAPGERPPEKQKPNFKPTGLLAKEANTVTGTTTVLKYHEPPEARKPPSREAWRLYVFKGKDMLDTVSLSNRSAWLIGRDLKVTDYPIDHPSVSKQHAVIQFRHRTSKNEFGDVTNKVKPYLIDLESANGTHLNGKKIEASRYIELVDQDVVKFGDSEREYVVMLPPAEK